MRSSAAVWFVVLCTVVSFDAGVGTATAAEFFGLANISSQTEPIVNGISADGSVVVGHQFVYGEGYVGQAWRWTTENGFEPLPGETENGSYIASAVSADGSVIVGTKYSDNPFSVRAVKWTDDSGPVELLGSWARDVSDDGSAIVGYSGTLAIRWTAGEGREPLGQPGAQAKRVSADGSVIAVRSDLWPDEDGAISKSAWLWTEESGFEYLGRGIISDMTPDASVVVGFTTPYPYEDFRWTKQTGMTILPFSSDSVTGVSPDGSVIFGANGDPPNAFMWDEENEVRDLRDVLDADFGLGSELQGWRLGFVADMSADGRTIIGRGTNPDGDSEPWMVVLDPPLQAGDADQDGDFDQLDVVQVQTAVKYLTGRPATWGEGDWNGAPFLYSSTPPAGDGVFNQLDIVAAQQAGLYLTGPFRVSFAG